MRDAFTDLQGAKKILIIGYSFPRFDFLIGKALKERFGNITGLEEIRFINSDPKVCDDVKSILSIDKLNPICKKWDVDDIKMLL